MHSGASRSCTSSQLESVSSAKLMRCGDGRGEQSETASDGTCGHMHITRVSWGRDASLVFSVCSNTPYPSTSSRTVFSPSHHAPVT